MRFGLPMVPGVDSSVYTGCDGFQFGAAGCSLFDLAARRFGNAGIFGSSPDSLDPAASFAPNMNPGNNSDIVFAHQVTKERKKESREKN